MAHHVTPPRPRRDGWLPGSRLTRIVVVTLFLAMVALLLVPIGLMGGLATANENPPRSDPGEPISNALFTVTPHTAQITVEEDGFSDGPILVVEADFRLDDTEAQRRSALNDLLVPVMQPGGEEAEQGPDMRLQRRPEANVYWLQPGGREEVRLTWTLPEDFARAESVLLQVVEAEYGGGFVDQEERWRPAPEELIAGEVVLPLEGGS